MLVRDKMLPLIDAMASAAKEAQQVTGLPASVLIAQALVESKCGRSKSARELNNFFNISSCPIRSYAERPIEGELRIYESATACFVHHAQLLETFYPSPCSVTEEQIPFRHKYLGEWFLRRFSSSSYSRRKKYWADVWQAFERWNLAKFDKVPSEKNKEERSK